MSCSESECCPLSQDSTTCCMWNHWRLHVSPPWTQRTSSNPAGMKLARLRNGHYSLHCSHSAFFGLSRACVRQCPSCGAWVKVTIGLWKTLMRVRVEPLHTCGLSTSWLDQPSILPTLGCAGLMARPSQPQAAPRGVSYPYRTSIAHTSKGVDLPPRFH